jgi:hypothetical protein
VILDILSASKSTIAWCRKEARKKREFAKRFYVGIAYRNITALFYSGIMKKEEGRSPPALSYLSDFF